MTIQSPDAATAAGSAAAEAPSRWRQHWLQRWYPVACLSDLDPARPSPFTLLEQDLVLWYDRGTGQWRAFADVCPHRLVPLHDGRINSRGELECPYHGWSFNGSGQCTTIPQAEAGAAAHACASPRSRCRSYATASAQGLLFVFAGDPELAESVPLPLVPPLQEPGWLVQDTFRDLPMEALTLLENVLDVSHVPFTHHRTVGRRQNAAPVEAHLTGADASGFSVTWPEGPRRGRLGSMTSRFAAPALMWHDLTAGGFGRILTVVYATPIRPGECRLFARFPFQFRSRWPRLLLGLRPRWLQHLANHTVLEDDQVFLHWQERRLAAAGGSPTYSRACFLPSSADVHVQALHRWVSDHGGEPFPGRPLPPRQALTPLMDRYHSHTRHCRHCRRAHGLCRRWRPRLQRLALALPLLTLGLVQLWQPADWTLRVLILTAAALATGLTLLAERQLGRWQHGLEQGSGEPPRNRPERRRPG